MALAASLLVLLVCLGTCGAQPTPVNTWNPLGPSRGISKDATEYISFHQELPNFDRPTVAYTDRKTNLTVWQQFPDGVWKMLGGPSIHAGVTLYTRMALDSVGRHIVAYRGGSKTVSVLSYNPDKDSWLPLGARWFTGLASHPDLAVNPSDDAPWVSYVDEKAGGKLSVQRFDGTKWGMVGPRAFSPAAVIDTRLRFDADNTALVAAIEPGRGSRASVWRQSADKTKWTALGPLGAASPGRATSLRLEIDPGNNVPIVAYIDLSVPARPQATASRWDGAKWVKLPSAGAVPVGAQFVSLGSQTQGELHLVFPDASAGGRTTLRLFTRNRWTTVGSPGITRGMARWVDLAYTRGGDPMIASADAANGNKTTMMQWSSPLVTFQALGDWGRRGQNGQKLVAGLMGRVAAAKPLNLVISTGDNFYESGLSSVEDPQFKQSFMDIYTAPSLQAPWFGVLGNHDHCSGATGCPACSFSPLHQLGEAIRARDSRWNIQRDFSDTTFGGGMVELFYFDSSVFISEYQVFSWALCPGGIRTQNAAALLASLGRKLRASTAKWKILVGHHPTWSNGAHGNNRDIIAKIEPLILRHKVQAYFVGHDHNLEHIRKKVGKATYDIIVSGGGAKVDRQQLGTVDSLFYHSGNGFVQATVQNDELAVEFYTLAGQMVPAYTARIPRAANV